MLDLHNKGILRLCGKDSRILKVHKGNEQMKEGLDGLVRGLIMDFLLFSGENTLGGPFEEPAWDEPLVGFARGEDPLFEEFKEHVGPFHMTPSEVFENTFPGARVEPERLTVISWILPQTEATKRDNRIQKLYPSERWARARIFGEEVNEKLRRYLVSELGARGFRAVAPVLSPFFKRVDSERFVFASTWSERHVAFAAGLGTFGLCDGLITPKGKAVRIGSVVAEITIPSTSRPYEDHHQYCLFFTKGLCGKCMERCPVGAISPEGHDKIKCERHLRPTIRDYVKEHYGFDGYGCGLCQTAVPCEGKIPGQNDIG